MAVSASGFRAFVIVWIGQFVSLVGTNLAGFALSVYVYQLTQSATVLGLIFAVSLVPNVVASPFTGALVDRWGPRRALYVGSTSNIVITVILAVIFATDSFQVWHAYVATVVIAIATAFEQPAFAAVTPLLVTKQDLGRANGLRVFAMAVSQVLAPVSAGTLLLVIDIEGIILLNALSFGVVIACLLLVRIPSVAPKGPSQQARHLLREFADAGRYVSARRGLFALMLFIAAFNFCAGFIELLITPLVLAFGSTGEVGLVLSIGGLGMITSGVASVVWGGVRRRVRGVLAFSLVLALAVVAGSTRPDVALVATCAFIFMAALGLVVASSAGIWQTKVEPHLLGRVTGLVAMVSTVPQLVANVVAGVSVDQVFEPLVGRDDVRDPTLALLVGTGPGRGIALLLMLVGLLLAVVVAVAACSPRLRHVETELPDVAFPSEAGRGDDGSDEADGDEAGSAVTGSAVTGSAVTGSGVADSAEGTPAPAAAPYQGVPRR